jgi:hypothetical protein
VGDSETCPVCSESLDGERPVVGCQSCATRHHEDCWAFNQGCAAYGCAGKVSASPSPPAVAAEALPHFQARSLGWHLGVPLGLGALLTWGAAATKRITEPTMWKAFGALFLLRFLLELVYYEQRVDPERRQVRAVLWFFGLPVYEVALLGFDEVAGLHVVARQVSELFAGASRAVAVTELEVQVEDHAGARHVLGIFPFPQWSAQRARVEAASRALGRPLLLPPELLGHQSLAAGTMRQVEGVAGVSRELPPTPEGKDKGKAEAPVRVSSEPCVRCQEEILDPDELVLCDSCSALHHRTCFEVSSGCGRQGCAGSVALPMPVVIPPELEGLEEELLLVTRDVENDGQPRPIRIDLLSLVCLLVGVLLMPVGMALGMEVLPESAPGFLRVVVTLSTLLGGVLLMRAPGIFMQIDYAWNEATRAVSRRMRLWGVEVWSDPAWLPFDAVERVEVSEYGNGFQVLLVSRDLPPFFVLRASWSEWYRLQPLLVRAAGRMRTTLQVPASLAPRLTD